MFPERWSVDHDEMLSVRPVLAALLGASALVLLPSAAHASPPTDTKTITVSAPYTDPEASEFDGAQCAGFASTPSCGVRFVGTSTWSGTITGDEHYELEGGPTADGKLTYEGPAYIMGTIEGCGSGSFIIDNYDGYIDYAKTDPNDNLEGGVGGSAPGFNRWKIRAGSGTGGLAGLVSGGGVNHWRIYNQGTAGLGGPEGIGLFTGTITCEVPRAASQANGTGLSSHAEPRIVNAGAVGEPPAVVSNAEFEPARASRGELPRSGGAAVAAAFAGLAVMGVGLVARRVSRG